jgi:hypothetical protein
MDEKEALEYMENEIRCVQRSKWCDRDCFSCELVKEDKPLVEAYGVTISALEKQIPKKVKYLNRHGDGEDLWNKDYFNCPSCGRRLRNKQKDKHCGRCGQALDWTDDNE